MCSFRDLVKWINGEKSYLEKMSEIHAQIEPFRPLGAMLARFEKMTLPDH